jgi:ABC-2 type transport system permease protein
MIARPLRLFWLYVRLGVLNELQYRVNFFVQIVQSLVALGAGLAALALVFSYTQTLAGWTQPELLAVLGVYVLVGGFIKMTIQPNMTRLMEDVQEGTLDFVLTKPEDAQLLVSVREIRLWQVVDVVLGAIVLAVAISQLGEAIGIREAVMFAFALALGAMMIYSLWLIITTGAFWVVRMENVIELLQGLYQAGRWPVDVYPSALRLGLTFLVPVGIAITVPAEALTARLTPQTFLLAAGVAAVLVLFSRWFWTFGLRHYSGASA